MKKKFVVRYELPYVHEVAVGIEASSSAAAAKRARRLFEDGELWDDTQAVPLLLDEFEEDGDAGAPLAFTARAVDVWPEPDASVYALRKREHARHACELLVAAYDAGERCGGSVDWEDLDQAVTVARETLASTPGRRCCTTGVVPSPARVLIVVRGGVAEVSSAGKVETLLFDLDDRADDPDGYPPIPAEFEELAREAGVGEHLATRAGVTRPQSAQEGA